jgi:2-polyprenyl-3-methyl-5-hydroxy-6-metoxy-1,4-benzoquinol methylase
MTNELVCPLCGSESISGRFNREGWNYVECDNCAVIFLSPVPSAQELRAYYNEAYKVSGELYARGTERSAPPILKELRLRLPSKGRLLEVGCSYGRFLDAARRDGWEVTGIELDDGAATYGRENLKLKILSGTLESQVGELEPPYDAIVTLHVIEHVPDPMRFLRLCEKLLKKEGILILKTPNVVSWIARKTGAYWQWLCPPAHIHLFSPQTLKMALERCGFRTEEVSSQRGDAHNNLFELVCAAARFLASRKIDVTGRNGLQNSHDGWHVKTANVVSDLIYFPLGLVIDPWLEKRGLQPELVVVARGGARDGGEN